ncbi:MAG: MogA/MoaB family molybdenum cofactor biosynthesis protein [Actinobacteria bacterium]|nr:MogA/MoaB family molybdenum cofactor biosynthesis protein [Actinomycetota bacterium]
MATALRIAVVTVSDRAAGGTRDDRTGPGLVAAVKAAGHSVQDTRVIPDGEQPVADAICDLAHDHQVVLLAGGTGIGPRDHTAEGVQAACRPMVPGVGEAIRAASRARIPAADLSRACAGVRGRCLVVALPGSPGGAVDGWDAIAAVVPHAVAMIAGGDHPG